MRRFINFILFLQILFFANDLKAQSLYLSGPTNWVAVGDLDVPGDQLTVEALILYTGASGNIVSKHTDPQDVNYLLRIGGFEITTTSGFAAFSGLASSNVSLVPNQIYHLAATYNGALLKYYVNGCLTGQMPWTGNMVQTDLVTAIGNMSFCQCEQFTGYIDEVRIWNVARTQAEISANMVNLLNPAAQIGLLGYWKFEGNYNNLQGNAIYNGIPKGVPQFQQIPLPYPSTLHMNVTSSNPICAGDTNGLINVSASGFYKPYEYSLDGITFGSSPAFLNLAAGSYTVYTRPQNNNNCTSFSTVTITDPPVLNANLTTTNTSCSGTGNGTASVAPTGGDGPSYHQLWQPSLDTSTTISGLNPGNYSVTVSDTCRAAGHELVVNGHFEDGNTAFTSGYTCCAGNPGNYAVDTDPFYYNPGHSGSGYGGGGNYLIVDGSTIAGTSFWCQTVTVLPNTYYLLSAFISTHFNLAPAVVDFTINGTFVGTLNAPATTYTWQPFQVLWFSGTNTNANICINNQSNIMNGNDFGIDNISFKTCLSCVVTTPFTVTEPSPIVLATSKTNVTCFGGTNGSATAIPNGGTPGYAYSWNTVPAQSTATASSLGEGTYIVTITDANGCSNSASVTITGPPLLVNTTINSDSICIGYNTTLVTTASGGTAPYSFSWDTQGSIGFANTSSTIVNPAVTTSYTVNITDANGCSKTDNVIIYVDLPLSLSIAGIDITCNGYCNGQTIVIPSGGNIPYSYNWSSGCTSAACSNLCPGSYTITVTDSWGCIISDDTSITEPAPLITAISGFTPASCYGACDGTATVSANSGTGAFQYSWNSSPVQTTATATNLCAGSYTCTVTDANNCSALVNVTIVQPQALTLANITAPTICMGSNATLTTTASGGNGGYNYTWLPTGTGTGSSATVSPTVTTTYTVTVTDSKLCSAAPVIVVVTVKPPLTIISSSDTAVCLKQSAVIKAFASGGDGGPYSYTWSPAGTGNTSVTTVTPTSTTTYTVTVTDGCGTPPAKDTVVVTIWSLPIINFTASDTAGCTELCVNFIDNTSVAGGNVASWAWNFGDGKNSVLQNPSFCFIDPKKYSITLAAVSNNGCIGTFTNINMITVFALPIAEFSTMPNTVTILNSYVTLNNLSSSDVNYWFWRFGDGDTLAPNTPSPYHKYPSEEATYTTTLIVRNANGCYDSVQHDIIIGPDFTFYIPNAFSPNGDGINDLFFGKGIGISQFEIYIFDRWGNMIFHGENLSEAWDGKANHGAGIAQQDIYVWKVNLTDVFHKTHNFIGTVTLVK